VESFFRGDGGKRREEREKEGDRGGNGAATDEAAAATEQIYVSDVGCWISDEPRKHDDNAEKTELER
jgi:hypothetical protein